MNEYKIGQIQTEEDFELRKQQAIKENLKFQLEENNIRKKKRKIL